MTKHFLIATALLAAVVTLPSCKKDKKKGCMDPISLQYDPAAEEDDGSCTYAGTGGNTTIVAMPEHHHVPITSKVGYPDTAYVKFNTQDSPGSSASAYDLVVLGETGEDHVHLEGLKPGKYYIMMTGWDSTINQRVVGGIPYILTQASGEVHVEVPVTE